MADVAQSIIPIARARRVFENHKSSVIGVTVFPDGGRMVTSSDDKTLCLWDLKDGVVLKKMEGHHSSVCAITVSGNGKLIASGDWNGELIAWDGDTGESLTLKALEAHSKAINSLNFSPDSAVLATVSWDKTIKLWRTDTWQIHANPIDVGEEIYCVRYSPSGQLLAIATRNCIQIWSQSMSECIAKMKTTSYSLAWTPDGTRLLSGGYKMDPTIREWDTSTWNQVGDHWSGHAGTTWIWALAVNSTGTLLASASDSRHVRLWRISDRRTIAVFSHFLRVFCVTFSTDGKYILCGGQDKNVTEWSIPEGAFLEDTPNLNTETSTESLPNDVAHEPGTTDTPDSHCKIFSIHPTIRDACVTRDLSTAQGLLTQDINLDRNNHNAYANRSFVLARKYDWDNALHDALQSLSIQASLPGYISKGIAHCGKLEFDEATKAFDLAFMFTAQDLATTRLILLVKAIALFNANRQEEAMQRIKELANICPDADTVACHVVEAYLHIQLGTKALNDARHSEAADHFTAAVNSDVLSNEQVVHSEYEIFVILFGWDFTSSWQTAHQNRCHAFLQGGKLVEAQRAHTSMMAMRDKVEKADCLEWATAFKKKCSTFCVASADAALAASEYGKAIELYSAVIDLGGETHSIFANRCKAKLGKMLWEEALVDAQKVTELNPRSYLGFHLKHAALRGARQYGEATKAIEVMLSILDDAHDPDMQALRQQYISSDARAAIRNVIDTHLEDTPPRLLNTSNGRLCDREAQIATFKTSLEYNDLLLSTNVEDATLQMQHIQDVVVAFFSYVMLSHRWERKEPFLHEIEDKVVYDLNPVEGFVKLQSFCKTVRDTGYRWAWTDTCCIDQNNNFEVQRSVNSMFAWYHHSALTIIYLFDVPPSSQSGAMARSVWIRRGWTVQEFLAPKTVLFYQNDWSLYLDDRTPNHKESAGIMQELEVATGINEQALTAFRPGMRDAREKLQWASMRVTTLPEDIAYSLFGLFGVHIAVIYGEKKHNALGRLLQEIIAQSGDVSCLDWIGKSSEFNSCLPFDITSYATPPPILPSLSEEEIETSVSSLRNAGAAESALQLYAALDRLSAPRFAHRRLRLPCIVFTVKEVMRRSIHEQGSYFTHAIKATGLDDMLITTEDKLIPFARRIMPFNQQTFLLVRPWDRDLMELHDSADLDDDTQSITTNRSGIPPRSTSGDPGNEFFDSESDSQALRLLVRLGQPFRAFLLAQQGREFSRVAADYNIIAHVKDAASARELMDVRRLEIL